MPSEEQTLIPLDEILAAVYLIEGDRGPGSELAENKMPTMYELWRAHKERAEALFDENRL